MGRADTAFRELVELGRERGDEAFLPYVYVLAAQNDCLRGDFERAGFHADAGREDEPVNPAESGHEGADLARDAIDEQIDGPPGVHIGRRL